MYNNNNNYIVFAEFTKRNISWKSILTILLPLIARYSAILYRKSMEFSIQKDYYTKFCWLCIQNGLLTYSIHRNKTHTFVHVQSL